MSKTILVALVFFSTNIQIAFAEQHRGLTKTKKLVSEM
jgi:hypothetical protein